jgi:hypothetical protein
VLSIPVADRALCPLSGKRAVFTQIHRHPTQTRCCWFHHGAVTLFTPAPRDPEAFHAH